MTKALWFSKDPPTTEQIKAASEAGYDIIINANAQFLGGIELRDEKDVKTCVSALLSICGSTDSQAIIGTFPPPILAQIARTADDVRQRGEIVKPDNGKGDYPCFAAWDVIRVINGGTPTFKCWVGIGRLNQDSCRWL